ncbi:MAG: hypothetical protein PGN13_10685 [Patulibacter minatonensis]
MVEEHRLTEWLEAERRIAREDAVRRRLLERLTDLVASELRRRLGQPFVLRELIDEYERGTSWAVDLLTDAAPREPWAWAPSLAVDAAFSRYARFARDVGGGRWTGARRDRSEPSERP